MKKGSGPSRWFTLRKLLPVDTCGRATTGSNLFSCKQETYQLIPGLNLPKATLNYNPTDFANCPNFGPSFPGHPSVLQGGHNGYLLQDLYWEKGATFTKLDCFYSPMVRYRSAAGTDWSARYLPAVQAKNDAYTVSGHKLTVNAASGVTRNDSIFTAKAVVDNSNYTVSVTKNVSHGTLTLNSDGSFTYTRGTFTVHDASDPCQEALGQPYCGPDSFQYKVCAQRLDGDDCATATVQLTVANAPPSVYGVSLQQSSGTYIYKADYTYFDKEGDPEQGTTFDWYVTDVSGALTQHVTHKATLGISQLNGPSPFKSVQKVVVTPHAKYGSWPDNKTKPVSSDQQTPSHPVFHRWALHARLSGRVESHRHLYVLCVYQPEAPGGSAVHAADRRARLPLHLEAALPRLLQLRPNPGRHPPVQSEVHGQVGPNR